jgi:stearoyl-CoA desaturase (delta-9 desaturase)
MVLLFIGLFFAHHYLSLFFQTFFHHRYASHQAFTMKKGTERFFYICAWIAQGSSFLSVRSYAVMHRMHHAFTDTEKDPHSPSYSKNVFDMMWKTWKVYSAIYYKTYPVEDRFLKNVPDWARFEAFAGHPVTRLAWAGVYTTVYVLFAPTAWLWLLLPFHYLSGPVHGAIINWYAHKYGYENFEMDNTSENLLHIDFLMLGESYHNNHHKHPSSVNFGVKWHEFDPVYPVIRLLDKLRVIRIVKQPAPATVPAAPKEAIHSRMFVEAD